MDVETARIATMVLGVFVIVSANYLPIPGKNRIYVYAGGGLAILYGLAGGL